VPSTYRARRNANPAREANDERDDKIIVNGGVKLRAPRLRLISCCARMFCQPAPDKWLINLVLKCASSLWQIRPRANRSDAHAYNRADPLSRSATGD